MSTPLWIAAVMALRSALGPLHSRSNTQLVDRFITDTPPVAVSVGNAIAVVSLGPDVLYTGALLVLFATTMAELVQCTQTRVDWGSGKVVSGLLLLFPMKPQLCLVALALGAIGSLGPGIAAVLMSD